MNKIINSKYLVFICFFIVLLMMFPIHKTEFEPIEVGAVSQILHPDSPKGVLAYDPYNNYDYLIAFTAKTLGYNNRFGDLAPLFRLIETCLAIAALILLVNFIFKRDSVTTVVAVMLFIISQSGQIDQKTMIMPICLLAIYFFLKEKWFLSAVFSGLIFYLHIGLAVWWFIPACFALIILYFTRINVSLKSIFYYITGVILVSLPVIVSYLMRVKASGVDAYSIEYYYHIGWYCSSVILTFSNPVWLLGTFLTAAVFLTGYYKAKQAGQGNEILIPIVLGVVLLFAFNFIFADLLKNGTVVVAQLLRSIVYVEILSALMFAYLLAGQVKKGNIFFLIIYLLISLHYHWIARFTGGLGRSGTLSLFFCVFLLFEIIEWRFQLVPRKLFKYPVVTAIIFIIMIVPGLSLRSSLKSMLNPGKPKANLMVSSEDYLFNDIAQYTNEKIKDKNAVLLSPFNKVDFDYFTTNRIFLTSFSPIYDIVRKNGTSKFVTIMKDDLKFPPEAFFEDFSEGSINAKWAKLWQDLKEDVIRHWQKEYGVSYVIREKELPLKFPVIYRDPFWVIYEVK